MYSEETGAVVTQDGWQVPVNVRMSHLLIVLCDHSADRTVHFTGRLNNVKYMTLTPDTDKTMSPYALDSPAL